MHGYLLGYNPVDDLDRRRAASAYQILVAAGINVDLWAKNLRQQIFLGDETFVQQMQMHADPANMSAVEVPKTQRCQPSDLSQWLTNSPTRDEALWCAYKVSGITMSHLASELGLSVSRVSRIIANQDRQRTKGKT